MNPTLIRPVTLGFWVMVPVGISVLAGACGGGSSEKELPVSIQDGRMVPGIVSVEENEKVLFKFQTDQPGQVRLALYEVTGRVEPGKVTELRFTAFLGRFPNISVEGQGRPIYFTPDGGREVQIGEIDIKQKKKN